MTTRDKILKTIAENKPPAVPMPVIDIVSRKNFSLTDEFMLAVVRVGAQVVQVESMEALMLIHRLAGSKQYIINTRPSLGEVDVIGIKGKDARGLSGVYQAWIQGAIGVAENGAIWLGESSMINRLLPFICEHLIIVLDAGNIVVDMHQAYSKTEIDKEGYGVFLAGPSKTADIEQSLVIGAHGARSLVVYLIDKEYKKAE
jgi:L-lactate dehydrogenase complex protein LldG